MKTCPVCALDLEDSYLYCPDDGSTLTSLSGGLSDRKIASDASPVNEAGVVLYCPMCAAEYPLTFSSCPVHGVTLTKHSIPKPTSSESDLREPNSGSRATDSAPRFRKDEPKPAKPLTVLELNRPQTDSPRQATASLRDSLDEEPKSAKPRTVLELKRPEIEGPRQATASLPDSLDEESAPRFRKDEPKSAKPRTVLELKRPQIESPRQAPASLRDSLDEDSAPRFRKDEPKPAKRRTLLELKRPQIERPPEAPASAVDGFDDPLEDFPVSDYLDGIDHRDSGGPLHERRLEGPGFRMAAIATVILLAVLGLAAIYSLFSNFSRRSTPSQIKAASAIKDTPEQLPFVATPKEAQEYKEEPPAVSPTSEPSSEPAIEPERRDEPERRERIPTSPVGPGDRVSPSTHPMPKTKIAATPAPPSVAPPRISPPMPALPRGDSGGFDARLVRVRSRKTPEGVRYDLTFNMLERAGRAAQWQRVLISTRSASGASHSEAIPFSHRLGAAGALTFTISVELTGRSEADWQGRIVCTTLGWDNNGGPLQASFGANVTP